jgi:hypothetical protein
MWGAMACGSEDESSARSADQINAGALGCRTGPTQRTGCILAHTAIASPRAAGEVYIYACECDTDNVRPLRVRCATCARRASELADTELEGHHHKWPASFTAQDAQSSAMRSEMAGSWLRRCHVCCRSTSAHGPRLYSLRFIRSNVDHSDGPDARVRVVKA